jgi:hypothetical protein
MHAQHGDLLVGDAAAQLANERTFEHGAHFEHLPCLLDAGHGHERAARTLQGHETVATQLVQGLAHQRARDLEDVAELLLRQLRAGHQPALDDGGGDGLDDALGGPGRSGRCRHGLRHGLGRHDGLEG